MLNELRRALRRLGGSPAFTVFAMLTLAIGIGATTAIYSVTYAVMFRPLDIRDLDEVVNIYHSPPRNGGPGHYIALSWHDLEQLRARQEAFTEVLGWTRVMPSFVRDGSFRIAIGEMVEGHYFDFVGATPALGRALQPADDATDAPAVVVLSDAMWRGDFGADPGVIGQTIRLGEFSAEVVGVMPPGYRGVDMPNVMPTQFWMPIRLSASLRDAGPTDDRWTDPESRWVMVKARLAPDVDLAQARAEVEGIARALDESVPIGDADDRARRTPPGARQWYVMPAGDLHAHESVDAFAMPIVTALLAAVGLVLLVACTNLANMLLARGAQRTHEVAVRRALGASRLRLVGELTLDSLLLAIAGGGLGLLVALWLMSLMSGAITMGRGLVINVAPRLEWSVLGVALGAVAVSVLVFGLVPAWHATRAGLRQVLDRQTGGAVARWRGRRLLIAAQVGVSVTLLIAGAVFVRQMWEKATRDPGFDLDRIAASQFDFSFGDYEPDRAAALLRQAVDQLRADPSVERAALASRLPIHFTGSAGRYVGAEPADVAGIEDTVPYRREGRVATAITGSAGLVETLGLRLERGRTFDQVEAATAAPVVLLSRSLAERVFGTADAVGRTVYFETDPREVIGVYADVDVNGLGTRDAPTVVEPGLPNLDRTAVLVVRARQDAALAMVNLRETLRRLDPALPVLETTTGEAIQAQEMLVEQIGARVVASLGGFALALALIGLSGLLTYLVASRRREIGLRMALGADRTRVVRLVLWGGLWPVLLGVVLGLGGGAWLAMFVGTFFYRRAPFDWTGLVVVPLLLVPAALAACYLPARRAAAVDPNSVLRDL